MSLFKRINPWGGPDWRSFLARFQSEVLEPMQETNRETVRGIEITLRHFSRLCQPGRLADIDGATFQAFIAARRRESVRATTVNKELDNLRVVLSQAHEWGYLAERPIVPRIAEEKLAERHVPLDLK